MTTIDWRNGGRPALPVQDRPASPKQIGFLDTLLAQRVLTQDERGIDPHELTAKQASELIGMLMTRPRVGSPTAPVAVAEGYYLQTDTVYRVVRAKSTGNVYAKRLVTTEYGRARWEYAPGAMRHLAVADALTLDQAREMGTRYGVCVVCGATLTDPDSVDRGIGPVCAAKL